MTPSSTLAKGPLMQPPVVERPVVGRPEDVGMDSQGPGAARRLTGVVINVAIAAVLVLGLMTAGSVYLNEGKLDASALSAARLKALFARSDLTTVDVSNGLYDTKGGRQVFFVRGEVQNRGKQPARVKVHAEIIDGAQVLQSQEALAGATPTPEDIFSLQSVQDASALVGRMDRQAVEVAPGKRAPFMLPFFDYPPDLAGLRLKVTLQQDKQPTQAARF